MKKNILYHLLRIGHCDCLQCQHNALVKRIVTKMIELAPALKSAMERAIAKAKENK